MTEQFGAFLLFWFTHWRAARLNRILCAFTICLWHHYCFRFFTSAFSRNSIWHGQSGHRLWESLNVSSGTEAYRCCSLGNWNVSSARKHARASLMGSSEVAKTCLSKPKRRQLIPRNNYSSYAETWELLRKRFELSFFSAKSHTSRIAKRMNKLLKEVREWWKLENAIEPDTFGYHQESYQTFNKFSLLEHTTYINLPSILRYVRRCDRCDTERGRI